MELSVNLTHEEMQIIESCLEEKLLNEIEGYEEIPNVHSQLPELSVDCFPDMDEEEILLTQFALKKIREAIEAENRRLYGNDTEEDNG